MKMYNLTRFRLNKLFLAAKSLGNIDVHQNSNNIFSDKPNNPFSASLLDLEIS